MYQHEHYGDSLKVGCDFRVIKTSFELKSEFRVEAH